MKKIVNFLSIQKRVRPIVKLMQLAQSIYRIRHCQVGKLSKRVKETETFFHIVDT